MTTPAKGGASARAAHDASAVDRVSRHWITLIGVAAVVGLVITVHPASVARALRGR
ncbi:MAG TPA: hypothetical protein VMU65_10860 [Candidatus Saccharimonadales bacterium]|nr:hypothetical protein [Candidatus Saccharimonadales bacterium]